MSIRSAIYSAIRPAIRSALGGDGAAPRPEPVYPADSATTDVQIANMTMGLALVATEPETDSATTDVQILDMTITQETAQ